MVEGELHTAKERSRRSTCVSWGAPLPPYIKEGGGEAGRPLLGAPGGGVLLLVGLGLPFPTPTRRWERKEEREKEGEGGKGGRPPNPIRFGLGGPHAMPPLFNHLAHEAQYFFPVFP